jgi:hypothetical protein
MNTQLNIITFRQRLAMLKTPPNAPVSGRGFVRVELTDEPEILDEVIKLNGRHPHVAAVSVRKSINRFGKMGYPKTVFCSPEFKELFQ